MVCAAQELRTLSTSELNGRLEQVLVRILYSLMIIASKIHDHFHFQRDRNIDQEKIDAMLKKMVDEQKRLLLTQHLKTDVSCTKKVKTLRSSSSRCPLKCRHRLSGRILLQFNYLTIRLHTTLEAYINISRLVSKLAIILAIKENVC